MEAVGIVGNSMRKKVIFTQRVEIIETYNERRDCADQRIALFIEKCGYCPVPVPNNAEIALLLLEELKPQGIILTGGNSLVKYGGNAPERDETDRMLISEAVKRRLPLYGFCRGMQSILDYFGNDLENVTGHVAVKHIIQGCEETRTVNSYHNQGCLELKSTELECCMRSDDGVIEKVKHNNLPIIGTMWHPEREEYYSRYDTDQVKKLIEGVKH